jgi:FkbM family methyltransferase
MGMEELLGMLKRRVKGWLTDCSPYRLLQKHLPDEGRTHEKQPDGSHSCCVEIESSGGRFKMLLSRPGYIEDRIAQHRCWEQHIVPQVGRFMRPGGLFLDVGANIGYYSLYVASSLPGARCIAFEPNAVIFRQLVENIRLNSFSERITAHETVVSDCIEETDFYMQKDSCHNRGLSSVLRNYDLELAPQHTEKLRLKSATIDGMVADADRETVSVIKVDTQGNEFQVIRGALDTIARAKPVIFFEFEAGYHPHDPAGYLNGIRALLPDYRVLLIDRKKSGSFREFDAAVLCRNRCFVGDFICLPTGSGVC